jgi:ABC-2 type transport system ATP-binding protein
VGNALAVNEVTKRFGRSVAVDSLTFCAPVGQVLGFLGPNGAGKTTTLRMIMGILYPDSGCVEVLGQQLTDAVKDRVGYLPEERGLYRKMTVEATLRYFGHLKGLRGRELSRRIDDHLARVGLADRRKSRVETLSKGMQQKLQFICTLLHEPELVILDEPFAGLDPLNVDLLERLLLQMRQAGRTVIFSTHQMEQAERLCDRIVLINRGRKLLDGTLAEIRARFNARMLVLEGEGNFSALARRPEVRQARVSSGQARLELRDGADVDALLHQAVNLVRLRRFELQRPSLQEIFVRLVGEDRPQADAAGPEVGCAQDHPGRLA